jgi:phage terminase large subunit
MRATCCWCQKPFVQVTQHQLSFWSCLTPTCLARQNPWCIPVGKAPKLKLLYVPLPRQVEALEQVASQQYKWILFGGARGGGKSRFLRWMAYYYCLKIPGFQVLLLRRTYPELEKSHMRWMSAEAIALGADYVPSLKPPVMRFANGSIIELGHCQDMQAADHYLSAEYNLVLPDELGTFEEDMIVRIASTARIACSTFRPCIVAATNPGAMWVKDRWITKLVDKDRYGSYDPSQYCFIQSKLDDNPYPDADYEAFLNALDPVTKAAWRDGSWDVFEGQYFQEFRYTRHVQSLGPIDPTLPRLAGLDWGYASPGVCLWSVYLPDGHLHIEREYKFRETVAAEVAQELLRRQREQLLTDVSIAADPSMWIRSGQLGESIAETMQRAGVAMRPAKHERINGWQRVRHWLREAPDGTPWLTIDPSCEYLLKTLPGLVHDKTRFEDVDTEGDDHAADALRYLLMSRPSPPGPAAKPPLPPDSLGAMLQTLCLTNSGGGIIGQDNVRPV